MSGIAGVYHLDGRPADVGVLLSLLQQARHRGPDGVRTWVEGEVGLGHLAFHTTPESSLTLLPFAEERSGLSITFDGRIDNRLELVGRLRGDGLVLDRCSDAELALRAYEHWGEECAKQLLGDFSFAIWDRNKRQLYCARDFLGIRPFYYFFNHSIFVFGSDLRQVIEHEAVPVVPNEGFIGELLVGSIVGSEETLFRDVVRLPPAHYLVVTPRSFRTRRYWDIEPGRSIRYRSDEEYAAHFLHLIEEATRCRMRSRGGVGAHLSGGLDSSAVTAMASSLYSRGDVQIPNFAAVSEVYPGLPSDESRYINAVIQYTGVDAHVVDASEANGMLLRNQFVQSLDFSAYPTLLYHLRSLAANNGLHVLLTGLGGNDWLEGRVQHIADLLRTRRFIALLRQAHYDTYLVGLTLPRLLLRFGVIPLAPSWLRGAVRRVRGRPSMSVPWLGLDFAKSIGLSDRLQRQRSTIQFPAHAQRSMYNTVMSGEFVHALETNERFSARVGVEERHPLNDKRIVEFAFAIPEEQRWQREQIKYILRNAMREYLPEQVRRRIYQADFSVVFINAFRSVDAEHIFANLSISDIGWVRGVEVRAMYKVMMEQYQQNNMAYAKNIWPLWMIVGVELWYRALQKTAFRRQVSTSS